MSTFYHFIVNKEEENQRLLTLCKDKVSSSFSTKDVRWAIEHHQCQVNKKVERFASYRVRKGDSIEISIVSKPKFEFDSQRILWEDDHLLFYNKPAGITSEDLAKRFHFHLVHRLDRDTTGVFLLAKTLEMQSACEQLFRDRLMQKSYLAIIVGRIPHSKGMIENYIGKISEKSGEGLWGVVQPEKGRFAKTEWQKISSSSHFSLVRCMPWTGRTHQLRIHLKSIHFPILGDVRYGNRKSHPHYGASRPLLHAESLSFPHPLTKETLHIKVLPPEDFNLCVKENRLQYDWVI